MDMILRKYGVLTGWAEELTLQNLKYQNPREEKDLLLKELDDLECIHAQLMKDLEANPGDERIINALIRHYQLKLEVMDQIIIQLDQIKSETSEPYEKESI